jgi:nitrogen fixation protein NifU and related proteins
MTALTDAERSMLLDELARKPHALGDGVRGFARSATCGDEVTVAVHLSGSPGTFIIQDFSWDAHGCTVSMAASAALSALAPTDVPELRKKFERYEASLYGGDPLDGDLEAFAGIGRFPLRAGCATLAWRAALSAIESASRATVDPEIDVNPSVDVDPVP